MESKRVAITGITGTLGMALADELDYAGHSAFGCSLSGNDPDYNEMLLSERVDVRAPEFVTWMESITDAGDDPPDALITCAGICKVQPSSLMSHEDFSAVMDTNVWGTFHAVREAIRYGIMRIVTVSSLLGGFPMGYPDRAAYIASKAAVAAMTRALAVEYAPIGAVINCVAPGHFSLMASKTSGLMEAAMKKQPSGKLVTADDVAAVIAWLVTDAPDSINGEVIVVDGGYTVNQWPVGRG